MKRTCRLLCWVCLLATSGGLLWTVQAQSNPQSAPVQGSQARQPAQQIPVIDGGAGPCSLDLTVNTADGRPVYPATVKVHIAYGFLGIRRLDLQAGTNIDGRVKFTGLPSRVHRPPLTFHAAKDTLVGIATYDPDQECHAQHNLVLDGPKTAPSK